MLAGDCGAGAVLDAAIALGNVGAEVRVEGAADADAIEAAPPRAAGADVGAAADLAVLAEVLPAFAATACAVAEIAASVGVAGVAPVGAAAIALGNAGSAAAAAGAPAADATAATPAPVVPEPAGETSAADKTVAG